MDFKDQIKQISERVEKVKDNLQTEEATKNALIMPFLQALGYDIFDPTEVIPEFTCDIAAKKGEKIDYAIFKDGKPVILIECKHWKQDLNLHDNQLLRYYTVSNAKFGILTNGVIYRFYTDLETTNKMDEKPFLEVNLLDLKVNQVDELKKFHKAYFDLENILNSANELKYTGELRTILGKEFTTPSPELVKMLAKQVYDGQITAKVLEQFTILVRRSISNHINDMISDRLKTALKTDDQEQDSKEIIEENVSIKENNIMTTSEEIETFFIVKSILRSIISAERVTYRDTKSYFTILIDGNNRKLVCRVYLSSLLNKYLAFIEENKKEMRHKIETLDDIYNHSDKLIEVAQKFV